jgi:hypothetical protein
MQSLRERFSGTEPNSISIGKRARTRILLTLPFVAVAAGAYDKAYGPTEVYNEQAVQAATFNEPPPLPSKLSDANTKIETEIDAAIAQLEGTDDLSTVSESFAAVSEIGANPGLIDAEAIVTQQHEYEMEVKRQQDENGYTLRNTIDIATIGAGVLGMGVQVVYSSFNRRRNGSRM